MTIKQDNKKDNNSVQQQVSEIFAKKRMGAFVDSRIKSNLKNIISKNKNFDINSFDDEGRNALHHAIMGGHQSTVDYLLRKTDANPSKEDGRGDNARNPLHYSYRLILSHFIKDGVYRPTQDNNYTISKNITLTLLKAGAVLNQEDFLTLCTQYCFDADIVKAAFEDERIKQTKIGVLSDGVFDKLINLHHERITSMNVVHLEMNEETGEMEEIVQHAKEYSTNDTPHGRIFELLLVHGAGSPENVKKLTEKMDNRRQHSRQNVQTSINKEEVYGPMPQAANKKEASN